MKQTVLRFGMLALAILLLLQLAKYSMFFNRRAGEWYVGLFAIAFLAVGFTISHWMMRRKPLPKPTADDIDEQRIEKLGISKREYEVLELMVKGLSNREIATRLFISESTVKTHVSNLLSKLDARRRTQAIRHAKDMKIV